jgi:thiol-disulfide isomerase/thioredoxin
MKKFTTAVLILLSIALNVKAQTQYEILKDRDGSKMLKGIVSKELLTTDTAFKWFAENETAYTPQSATLAWLKNNPASVEFIVFLGTWCEDSHFIVPKFYMLLDAAGVPADRVTLIATDRNKKTVSHLAEAFNITNVPTIIVMKDGKEMGRVIEYGKYGLFDKDLEEIFNTIH